MFALVLVSPREPDLEAAATRLMEPLMQRGVREWWTIGGRYDGVVLREAHIARPARPPEARSLLANNHCMVSELPADLSCNAVVTPDGVWHEGPKATGIGSRNISRLTPDERSTLLHQVEAWEHEQAVLLATYADHVAIGVDYGVWL